MTKPAPEAMTLHVVGLSGGKDSTALALRLAEVEPRDYTYLITPTGDELPEMVAHWQRLEVLLGKPLTRVTNGTLASWIQHLNGLPNFRMRWCTRVLKIEPTIAFMVRNAPAINYVGLRADEETREGIYGDSVVSRYPLREWGWGLAEVRSYLAARGVEIPRRTDCARCYHQRLIEWKTLLRKHPDIYASAEADEARTGHTFRSPKRDTWPTALSELRVAFDSGRKVRGEDCDDEDGVCRVCSL
jgi:hypothetical protein